MATSWTLILDLKAKDVSNIQGKQDLSSAHLSGARSPIQTRESHQELRARVRLASHVLRRRASPEMPGRWDWSSSSTCRAIQQLRLVVDLLDSSNVLMPHRLPAGVESPLEERAELVQLCAVDSESALDLVCGPVLTLTLLATVESWRLFAVHISTLDTTSATVVGRSGIGRAFVNGDLFSVAQRSGLRGHRFRRLASVLRGLWWSFGPVTGALP